MTVIEVNGNSPYAVTIESGLKDSIVGFTAGLGVRNVAVVTQPSVRAYADALSEALSAAGVTPLIIEVPDAEAGKTLEVAGRCWDELGAHNFSRGDAVIGLGGGAATDLAGFVAAAWMRGIKFIQVPTTLLAMVDAAVGGKTGINTHAGKNLVGAFHEPSAVYIDLDFLGTLPADEIVAGSAEIIKTGFIADPKIIELYESDPAACLRADGHLPELIARSVAVKANVVSQDLKESSLREILNYGHTFGHAVELRENFTWRHGRAVAVGMMFIAQLAHSRGLIDEGLVARHESILRSVGLPTSYDGGHFAELLEGMRRDKKNKGGHIRFVALEGLAKTTRLEDATDAELEAAYNAIAN
ncbi:3-dehydroquinate synthase [Corynebacterium vitaeruminis]|uniref:3-dehydroquinate synthase n=1 Tax=Corynebacterium vitaeruminis TaxID=38305 RepID=UPI00046D59FD|nr:3-dehydroquinate synthase [Corynebacterium vitaeruminis]